MRVPLGGAGDGAYIPADDTPRQQILVIALCVRAKGQWWSRLGASGATVEGGCMGRSREQRSAPAEVGQRAGEPILGWREWVGLPALRLPLIKAKVDTGARTSTLHAFYCEAFRSGGEGYVRFGVHPLQGRSDVEVHCEARILDRRAVSDSGGHRERRYVVRTPLEIGGRIWLIEVTLTNREDMLFRMLLGRTAIAGYAIVDPRRSFVGGRQRDPATAYRGRRLDREG
jgi:hypothetical protein